MSGCQFEDDLTEEEKHFEEIGAKASDIVLKTTHETCKYCKGKVLFGSQVTRNTSFAS